MTPDNFLGLPEQAAAFDQAKVLILPIPFEATVSYYCGPLCAGTYSYRIEQDGSSCKVVSREQFGPVS